MARTERFPRLLGDIGGTNARWAWQEGPDTPVQDISVQPCEASASLYDSAMHYLRTSGHTQPRCAAIGVATAVTGDTVCLTNNAWTFSIRDLQQALGLQHCLVINDFTALALSLPALASTELRSVGMGTAVAGAPIALIGPGTGLGVSGLIQNASGVWLPLSGEGGHVTMAATDEREAHVLALLRQRFDHVSAERVLSGPGLVELYRAVCEMHGQKSHVLEPSDISTAALAHSDPFCVEAAELFTCFLGIAAGNLALTLGALGGLYIGGGVVPQLGAAFDDSLFRERFESKGRFTAYLTKIPSWIITASTPALVGAARALDYWPTAD